LKGESSRTSSKVEKGDKHQNELEGEGRLYTPINLALRQGPSNRDKRKERKN